MIGAIRKDFPILSRRINNKKLVYLDNAATTQKPKAVIEAISNFYLNHNANIRRGVHTLSEEATAKFEEVYKKTAKFIGAKSVDEIIFGSGTTEAINMAAKCFEKSFFWDKEGEIIVTEMEHHSNILPWMSILDRKENIFGFSNVKNLKVIRINKDGILDLDHLKSLLTSKTKIVAISHISNVLGTINPVKEIVKMVKENSSALVLVDGAQAVPHQKINVQSLGCDFYAFSSHKMLGPTGVGVLWCKKEILEKLPPFLFGGGMIEEVYFDKAVWADIPHKFTAGTSNISGVIGFGAALDYLEKTGLSLIEKQEKELVSYCIDSLSNIPGLTIYGPLDISKRGSVVAFTLFGVHPHDLASVLDSYGIAIRSGHHCAMPLHNKLGISATARASFYLYNTKLDIEALVAGIKKAKKIFKV
ncbi:cysteine desulfurase CsdA [candidate division WWE3 bacterium CG09_land_8_20_14_0_10_39_24]|uniref:Cysteine desulfurase n=1 Tax=candidate division WWE3 bacterium CG09_land_8_20_14_0_10_39_24 TaxID=1975088 RepID=A0A2H0WK66_UNCKA|nr:MAG: hypothetical protein AUJ94_01480 [bacterium CG2_30_40_12]OJI09414.1 MAG: hypothetical protein BK003_00600 [bacterium CG09_39_24]PIS13083.1 MAG: cysteine desulfurase CsdA [candidate division WWE3 bacterium CG09_land_8_20_14_0_10_39_24]